jgi:hypothetical protein
MTGTVTAAAGEIGGFTIDSDEIKSGTNIGLNSNTKAFSINDTTFGNTGIQLEYNSGTPRAFIGKNTGGFIKFDGSNVEVSSSKFILGDINTAFISGSDSNIEISSSKFNIKNDGSVIMEGTITATGGTIGGFTIDADEIKSTNLLLDSANEKITVGSANAVTIQGGGTDNFITMGKTTFGQGTTVGAILGMDATVPTLELFKNATNNLTFNASGLAINTATFDLKTTPLRVSSSNGGAIGMGATAPTSLTAGDGIFMSGSGVFRAGNADGPRVAFDGTNIILSSSKFMLGSKGSNNAYISASGNNLEISASNFTLMSGNVTASNVDLSGKITATSGDIGGFTIDPDEIKSTNLLLDSTNEKITVGSSNAVTIQGGGTDNFIRFGSKTTYGQTTTAGVMLGMDATVPTLELFKDANNKFIFNNSGIDIKTATFNLVTTGSGAGEDGGIIMNSAQPLIMVSGSLGSVKGNSVRLLGDEGVFEVEELT